MKVRYSLSWMLVAVIYISTALAACVRPREGWVAALWLVNIVVFLNVALAAVYYRGRRQAMAAGFILFAGAYLVALWLVPEFLPERHLFNAAELNVEFSDVDQQDLLDRQVKLEWELAVAAESSNEEYRQRVLHQYERARHRVDTFKSSRALGRIIETITFMIAGLVGARVGTHDMDHPNQR